jgi:glycine hydroxymethyltransferase
LTHGSKVNFSGKIYESYSYGIDPETGDIDYAQVETLAKEHKPKMIICGFSAFSGILDWERFKKIAESVDAYLLADISHVSGLVAAGLYPNPFPHADVVTTTTHKTLVGPRGGLILAGPNEELQKKLNSALFPGSQGGPLMHVIAAKAVCFKEAMEEDFISYQKQILLNAKAMSKRFMSNDIDIVSNGTSNHMFLVNLIKNDVTGKILEAALGEAFITVNKNSVPNDPKSPFVTSGIRIGTPAVTRRGFQEKEVSEIADWISKIIKNVEDKNLISEIKEQVKTLCGNFPVYSQ